MSVSLLFRWGSVSMDVTRVQDDAAELTVTCDRCGPLGMTRVGRGAHPLEGGKARAERLARGHVCWKTEALGIQAHTREPE